MAVGRRWPVTLVHYAVAIGDEILVYMSQSSSTDTSTSSRYATKEDYLQLAGHPELILNALSAIGASADEVASTGCLLATRGGNKSGSKGYVRVKIVCPGVEKKTQFELHRLVYMKYNGFRIADSNLDYSHRCHNTKCLRDHVIAETSQANRERTACKYQKRVVHPNHPRDMYDPCRHEPPCILPLVYIPLGDRDDGRAKRTKHSSDPDNVPRN